MKIKVLVIHAFSRDGQGGNPAGVVFDADELSNAQKQKIAAAAGFPETAFVSSSLVADFKLDFFTPLKQIPHCGHATIATFCYLKQTGRITGGHSSKETIDGNRAIVFKGDMAFMEQRSPSFDVPGEDLPAILQSLHLTSADIIPGLVPTIVNTGNSFLMVPTKSETVLAALRYDKPAVSALSEKFGLIGFYVFTYPVSSAYDATARMFGPYFGIDEEAATGMAAGPLACYLYHVSSPKDRFLIEQGLFMQRPSPSLLHVDLEIGDAGIQRLFAGGNAYVAGEKIVEIF